MVGNFFYRNYDWNPSIHKEANVKTFQKKPLLITIIITFQKILVVRCVCV